MSFILCPKHGGHGAASVCEHVAAKVAAPGGEQSLSNQTLIPVRVTYQQQTLGPTWLCADCALDHGIPAEGLALDGEAGLERFLTVIGFTPVCRHCFEERYGRAA